MSRTIGIGHQDFEYLITNDNFYIDKTSFIKEWWENSDVVTLITLPRRFGKTLNLNIYNPWSIINYLKFGRFSSYWANTSSNSLIEKLIREGSANIKITMEDLLSGKTLCTQLDEQIVFSQLDHNETAL